MATWVEDIVQALRNLGGQATLNQIYDEVKRIRTEPLPANYQASIRERIEAHSSDSASFKGKDFFRKVAKGVWALRKQVVALEDFVQISTKRTGQSRASFSRGEEIGMTTWLEAILQALKNLGGQATNAQICEEVRRIKEGPFPKTWAAVVIHIMGDHSSDSALYKGGSDLFKKDEQGCLGAARV